MKTYTYLFIFIIIASACRKTLEAPIPNTTWDLFQSAPAQKLPDTTRKKLEGIYNIRDGSDLFGPFAALKWSYTVNGSDTTYHLSMFCEKDVTYIICEGRRLDSSILLNGYWRKMVNTETGKARFTISKTSGGSFLLKTAARGPSDSVVLSGVVGTGELEPDKPVVLRYQRPIYNATPFEIVAHRGGGRTSDVLPASENSVEMIKLASRFGATGIEIDVRLTSDGVPIIYHDATLNQREIQKNGMVGPIENYSFTQLESLVRLQKGEKIPTLEAALNTVVTSTPLRYVWLDTKLTGSLTILRAIQKKYMDMAASLGKPLLITIGIPDQNVLNNFMALPGYSSIPSVNELTTTDVEKLNSTVWGPRWTLGLQKDEVQRMHAEGRRAFVWTLDVSDNIIEYMNDGSFDGILSNYPSAVAYYYYAKQ